MTPSKANRRIQALRDKQHLLCERVMCGTLSEVAGQYELQRITDTYNSIVTQFLAERGIRMGTIVEANNTTFMITGFTSSCLVKLEYLELIGFCVAKGLVGNTRTAIYLKTLGLLK